MHGVEYEVLIGCLDLVMCTTLHLDRLNSLSDPVPFPAVYQGHFGAFSYQRVLEQAKTLQYYLQRGKLETASCLTCLNIEQE